jgi:hypothetical protein
LGAWRAVLGLAVWLGVIAWAVVGWQQNPSAEPLATTACEVVRFVVIPGESRLVRCEAGVAVKTGEAIFELTADGSARLVGRMESTPIGPKAVFFAGMPFERLERSELRLHEADLSTASLMQMLLPAEKRSVLMSSLSRAWTEREAEILAAMEPAIAEMFGSVYPVAAEELEASAVRHWPDLEAVFMRHREQYLDVELAQLGRSVAWPMIREKAQPLTDRLAREIWQRVSVWKFGWRYVYDKVGLGDGSLEKEWNRFVTSDAMPIIESHTGEFVELAYAIFEQMAVDPQFQETLRSAVARLVNDPEFQRIAGEMVKESLIDNARVREAVSAAWSTPPVQSAMKQVLKIVAPIIEESANTILSDGRGGPSRELVRVLRSGILGKDHRWWQFVSTEDMPTVADSLLARRSTDAIAYPLPGRWAESP